MMHEGEDGVAFFFCNGLGSRICVFLALRRQEKVCVLGADVRRVESLFLNTGRGLFMSLLFKGVTWTI